MEQTKHEREIGVIETVFSSRCCFMWSAMNLTPITACITFDGRTLCLRRVEEASLSALPCDRVDDNCHHLYEHDVYTSGEATGEGLGAWTPTLWSTATQFFDFVEETKFYVRQKRQQCRKNVRFCRKNRSTCSIRQCCFDIVAGVDEA